MTSQLTADDDPARRTPVYAERSPLNDVARLHGDLLLLHGSDDLVVPLDQATDLVEALRAVDKHVELIVYPGEGHGFRRAETIADSMEREPDHYQRAFAR
ncbi:MAG: prolyl oligopeptidase family serine peptidase [Tetrasphaera sp.]